ncbi:MAG: cation:proton antiporter [candidate division WOR-3 bacterium]|nr:cation:proton antiporter [candidate division WOR-3 bacterium]
MAEFIIEIICLASSIAGLYFIRDVSLPLKPLLNLGLILMTAVFNGKLFQRMHLPKITGYMVAGLIVSPYSFGLNPASYIKEFKLIDYFAITFIGMQAGSEMTLRVLKKNFRQIITITMLIVSISSIGAFFTVFYAGKIFFTDPNLLKYTVYIALFLAIFEVAKSPVTTIAIINESGIKNKFTHTVLGITIIKDIILVLLFTLVTAFVELKLSAVNFSFAHISPILIEIFGSILIGWLTALLFTVYLKYVQINSAVVIMIIAFILSMLGDTIHISPLITGICAGFFIENYSEKSGHFEDILSGLSPYIYVLFFPMASAVLDIRVIPTVILPVIMLLVMRKVFLFASFYVAGKITDIDSYTRKHGWMGLINQSGITLALAILVSKTMDSLGLPQIGMYIKTIAITSIIITDFYGPPLFKVAVSRSRKYFSNTK